MGAISVLRAPIPGAGASAPGKTEFSINLFVSEQRLQMMIGRHLIFGLLLFSVASTLFAVEAGAQSAQTDPQQYQARIAQEVKQYLSDCDARFTMNGQVFDPAGVASCKADQADFATEYYGALEGNQNDKFDVGFMFQRGDDFGVKYNATMACAWWIEMVDTGGRLPVNVFDNSIAQACASYPGATEEAQALYEEEQRVSNLTY